MNQMTTTEQKLRAALERSGKAFSALVDFGILPIPYIIDASSITAQIDAALALPPSEPSPDLSKLRTFVTNELGDG